MVNNDTPEKLDTGMTDTGDSSLPKGIQWGDQLPDDTPPPTPAESTAMPTEPPSSPTLILEQTSGDHPTGPERISLEKPITLHITDSSGQREMQVETLCIRDFSTGEDWTQPEKGGSFLKDRTIQLSGGILQEQGDGSILIKGTEENPLLLSLVEKADGHEQHEGLCVLYTDTLVADTAFTEEATTEQQTVKVEKTEDGLLLTDTMTFHAIDGTSSWQVEGQTDRVLIRNYHQGDNWSQAEGGGFISEEQSIQLTGGSCVKLEDGSLLIEGTQEQPLWLDLENDDGHKEHEGVCVIYQGEILAKPVEPADTSTPWLLLGGAILLTALLSAGLAVLIGKLRRHGKDGTPTKLSFAQMQNIGKRPNQQDSVAAMEIRGGLFAVVADGMGGLRNGDIVSKKIVQTLSTECSRLSADQLRVGLMPLLARANDEVNRLLGTNGLYQSGSTLVAAVAELQLFRWISVGDSRIYLCRGGKLLQLNREHNFEAELLMRAVNHQISFQEAWNNPKRGSVSSFLGMGNLKYVDEMQRPIRALKGDRFLLCSDGIYNTLNDQIIENILTENPNPAQALHKLEAAVLQAGNVHQDNFSAVIVCYD